MATRVAQVESGKEEKVRVLESLIQELGNKVGELENEKKGARKELEQARDQA